MSTKVEQSNKIVYVAIGIAVIALIVAIVAGFRPTAQQVAQPKVTFTAVSSTLNLTGWDWAKVGTLQVSGGDALVKFYIDGDYVPDSGYVKLINTNTGETIMGKIGDWLAVRSGTYTVYVKVLLTSENAKLGVEAYA